MDEKRRALEQAAPRVSLHSAIAGEAPAENPTGGAAAPGEGELVSAAEASVAESTDRRSVGSAPNLHRSSEAAQLRAMRLQQELRLREAEECTFHPRTNAAKVIPAKEPDAFFNRSQQWATQVAESKAERRKARENEQMLNCTFSPAVTPRRTSSAGGDGASAAAVVARLYQPQARAAAHQEREKLREEKVEQLEAECSFRPVINPPLRSNVATNVASRYRQPSPGKTRPVPTGAEECTFSPAVNRTPRALSNAVSEYLDDPAYLRLSRQPPTPRGAAQPCI